MATQPTRPLLLPGEAITLALLGAPAPQVLRPCQGRERADRERSARTHRRALCDREDDLWDKCRSTPRSGQDKSKPRVAALKTWLEHQLARVSAKAPIADEIRYGLNRWDGLTRFLDDGRIELDTNIVERGIRRRPRSGGGELGLHRLRAARLSALRRKSTGLVATSTRMPAGAIIMSPPSRHAAPSSTSRHQSRARPEPW